MIRKIGKHSLFILSFILCMYAIFLVLTQVAIHGYSAYGASKWALRGLAEALQMEVKPFGIYVSVSYPPDTDTPGELYIMCVHVCMIGMRRL